MPHPMITIMLPAPASLCPKQAAMTHAATKAPSSPSNRRMPRSERCSFSGFSAELLQRRSSGVILCCSGLSLSVSVCGLLMDVLCGRFRRFQAFLSLLCVVPGGHFRFGPSFCASRFCNAAGILFFRVFRGVAFVGTRLCRLLPLSALAFVGCCLCRVLPLPGVAAAGRQCGCNLPGPPVPCPGPSRIGRLCSVYSSSNLGFRISE